MPDEYARRACGGRLTSFMEHLSRGFHARSSPPIETKESSAALKKITKQQNPKEKNKMRPSHLSEFLRFAIRARKPIMIVGGPGTGKTDLVYQAAEKEEADVVCSHPVCDDPTVPSGLPWADSSRPDAYFKPYGILYKLMNAEKPTVCFLDDFGQGTLATQASWMRPILSRTTPNDIRLSEFVTFIVATNRRTDRAAVTGVIEPVKGRFLSIIHLEPNIDDWCDWALSHAMPAELIGFLRFKPELLNAFNPTLDLENSPTPRTWSHCGDLVNMQLPRDLEFEAYKGAVGAGAAAEFTGFLRTYRDLPSLDGILASPEKALIPTGPAALYAVAVGLASRVTDKNWDNAGKYAARLLKAGHGEFATLLIKDATRRNGRLYDTKTFIELSAGEMGAMITERN